MTRRNLLLASLAGLLLVIASLASLISTAPKNPVAIIRVLDASGNPVAGATLCPQGLRTKQAPYRSGWYGWKTGSNSAPNLPVETDRDGYARIPYPAYVFERIETGVIIFSVSHMDFVPLTSETTVSIVPPSGAPWQMWLNYGMDRIRHKNFIARPDPVILRKGASLNLSVKPGSGLPGNLPLFAQISTPVDNEKDFWIHPEPGVLLTHRLTPGLVTFRAFQIESNGAAWFGDVTNIQAVENQTNELVLELRKGAYLHGKLDASVPRPVTNGRTIVHVWPQGLRPEDDPPQWHTWSEIREDGTFDIPSLPEGDLEVVVICRGYISTNGPGTTFMGYPQKHLMGTNDLSIVVGMEKTARLEVHVSDDMGQPLAGVRIVTSPNVRYGEWAATIFGSDCYNMADLVQGAPRTWAFFNKSTKDFEGTSDSNGLAIVPNLPARTTEFGAEHPRFALPAVARFGGQKRRESSIVLTPGGTNSVWVQLEPVARSPITHF